MAKFTAYCLLVAAAILTLQSEAYQMSKCKLVKELRKQKFPEHQLRDWVCLVEHESARRTHVIGKPNTDGSRDYGLFQINDRYWCSNTRKPGNSCHVTCNDMKKKNISKAAKCAKKIFKIHNFQAWYGWVNNCQGKALPDISSC